MTTKITYRDWDGAEGFHDTIELIGYCKESPPEILQGVYKKHIIQYYKKIYMPVDDHFPNNCMGLSIVKEEAPKGTSIADTVRDLDLSKAEVLPSTSRTKKTYKSALKLAINIQLLNLDDGTNYLDTREQEKKEHMEEYIQQLLEVTQVTLRIQKPTVEDLKKIFRAKY